MTSARIPFKDRHAWVHDSRPQQQIPAAVVYLIPFLKYPANPPSIGDPETTQYRTAVYLVLILVSIVAMVSAVLLQRRLIERFGGWKATLIAGGAYILVTGLSYGSSQGIDEVPQPIADRARRGY